MSLTPQEFYEHALCAADAEGRLPLSRMTGWEIFPFDPDGLRVVPLAPQCSPNRRDTVKTARRAADARQQMG